MAGYSRPPTATTVAGLEPEMAPKNMLDDTAVMPRPPVKRPTSRLAKLTMRWDSPPTLIRLPVRMKNGIAISENLSSPANRRSMTMASGTWLPVPMAVMTEPDRAMKIGAPRISSTTRRIRKDVTMASPDLFDVGRFLLATEQAAEELLREAHAYQRGADRDRELHQPHRHLQR